MLNTNVYNLRNMYRYMWEHLLEYLKKRINLRNSTAHYSRTFYGMPVYPPQGRRFKNQ